MTSLPQTHQRISPAQDNYRRRPAAGAADSAAESRGRARESLPAIDPSTAFGCVDWFLYPDAKLEPELRRIGL